MPRTPLILIAATLLGGCVIYVGDNDTRDLQHEVRTQTLAATDLNRLIATTGAGKLDIIGEEGRENIEFVADVFARDPDDVELLLQATGETARLVANTGRESRQGGWAHIDLVVKMPARLALDLKDSSGDINIRGLQGSVVIEDTSGHLSLSGASSASINDGSGHLLVEHVTGAVYIEDGSGDIEIRHIGGEVTLKDGSGDIDISAVGGLHIINAGSGGLRVRDINGNVNLQNASD